MGMGITFVTKSNLGTSAISSIPYVLSLDFKLSFGVFTFIINVMLFFIQLIILGRELPKNQYLQLLVAPILGFFIDVWMNIFGFLNPINYINKLAVSVLGCIVIAISIILQLKANVVTNPVEGMVKTISYKTDIEFGKVKVYFDLILVLTASALSLILMGEIRGIREGTLITAILVGILIRVISKIERGVLKSG